MRVIGRPTRPLPVPGPWGLPGPYQVYAGTRLKTNSIYSLLFTRVSAVRERTYLMSVKVMHDCIANCQTKENLCKLEGCKNGSLC